MRIFSPPSRFFSTNLCSAVYDPRAPPPFVQTTFSPLTWKRVDLRSLYHAALAAPLLGADVSQGGSVLEKVIDLLGSDGSVRCVCVCMFSTLHVLLCLPREKGVLSEI